MDIDERFWGKVDKDGPVPVHRPELGKCWIWTASTVMGYGGFTVDGEFIYAHRFAWILKYGSIPKGLDVCHHCDIPCCVRWSHLFTGTRKENMEDCVSKGRLKSGATFASRWHDGRFRWQHGETNPRHKITDADVNEMRRLHRDLGWGYKRLHKHFGISFGLAQRIINRYAWWHLPDPPK